MCNTFMGSFAYMAPERFNGQPYGFSSDLWSLGLCVVECAMGKSPYAEHGTAPVPLMLAVCVLSSTCMPDYWPENRPRIVHRLEFKTVHASQALLCQCRAACVSQCGTCSCTVRASHECQLCCTPSHRCKTPTVRGLRNTASESV